jgi:hypothetical protein
MENWFYKLITRGDKMKMKSFTEEELQGIRDRCYEHRTVEYNKDWTQAYLDLGEAAKGLQKLMLETYHPDKAEEKTLTININNPEGLDEWIEQTLIPKIVKAMQKDVPIRRRCHE